MTKTTAQLEKLAAWHAEQVAIYRKKQRRCRRADRKADAAALAAHHEEAWEFLQALIFSLGQVAKRAA